MAKVRGSAGAGQATAPSRRRAARLAAVQALYQMELAGAGAEAVIAEFAQHRLDRPIEGDDFGETDREMFGDLVRGVAAQLGALDNMIAAVLTADWKVERLETILRAILRAGAYELSARADVPARVTINEYVELAHAFFAGKEPGFVNGALDRVARALRPEEVGNPPDGQSAATG